jgi:Rod binding domain-containing protein
MVETMFEGISTDGMFGGGNGEKVFRSLLINEYGKAMAKTGTVGVADYVMKSILEMQEVQSQGFIDGTKNKEV